MSEGDRKAERGELLRGVLTLVVLGTALGIGYNALGLESRRPWGLEWIGKDRASEMVDLDELGTGAPDGGPGDANPYFTTNDDPMAVAGGAAAGLPEIPELDRPIKIDLTRVKQFVDARAALVIDAREPFEYTEGHLPGAVSMPYDELITDIARLEAIDSGGRPIIVYCGGGNCELSMNLAYELIYNGKTRVLVYEGGFPEWDMAGNPVER